MVRDSSRGLRYARRNVCPAAADKMAVKDNGTADAVSDTSDYQRSTPSPRDLDDWSGCSCSKTVCDSDRESTDSGAFSELDASESSSSAIRLPSVNAHLQKVDIDTLNDESIKKEDVADGEAKDSKEQQGILHTWTSKELRKARLEQFLNLTNATTTHLDLKAAISNDVNTTAAIPTSSTPLFLPSSLSTSCLSSLATASTTSAPKTSKMPLKSSLSSDKKTTSSSPSKRAFPCRWQGCHEGFDSTTKLLDHLKSSHAATQRPRDEKDDGFVYKCLWSGCKVFNKGSSSKWWLEKHLSNHCDKKPFACIFHATCKMRFSTKSLLERHVHAAHMEVSESTTWSSWPSSLSSTATSSTTTTISSARKFAPSSHASTSQRPLSRRHSSSLDSSTLRMLRKSGKRLRYRSTLFSARIFDLFDLGVMAELRQRLHKSRAKHLQLAPRVISRRRNERGHLMLLVRWGPGDTREDEWIRADAFSSYSHGLPHLPHDLKASMCAPFVPRPGTSRVGRKRRIDANQPNVEAVTTSTNPIA